MINLSIIIIIIFIVIRFYIVTQNAMLDDFNVTSAYNETSTTIVETVMSTTIINDGPLVDSDAVSPVTLSMEWSRVARLLIMIGLSVVGSIGNVYMISSVMIEDHLNKRGEYYTFRIFYPWTNLNNYYDESRSKDYTIHINV